MNVVYSCSKIAYMTLNVYCTLVKSSKKDTLAVVLKTVAVCM